MLRIGHCPASIRPAWCQSRWVCVTAVGHGLRVEVLCHHNTMSGACCGLHPSQDTLAGDRSSPARGHAGVAAGGQQQQQPTSPPAALTGSVRAAVAGSADGNSTDATMAAAIGWQAEEAAADQQERLHFRQAHVYAYAASPAAQLFALCTQTALGRCCLHHTGRTTHTHAQDHTTCLRGC